MNESNQTIAQRLPKSLQRFAHLIADISDERHFARRLPGEDQNGDGIWLYLKKGFWNPDTETHSVHEHSWGECVAAMRSVEKCVCSECTDHEVEPDADHASLTDHNTGMNPAININGSAYQRVAYSPLQGQVIYVSTVVGGDLYFICKDIKSGRWEAPDCDLFLLDGVIDDVAPVIKAGLAKFLACEAEDALLRTSYKFTVIS